MSFNRLLFVAARRQAGAAVLRPAASSFVAPVRGFAGACVFNNNNNNNLSSSSGSLLQRGGQRLGPVASSSVFLPADAETAGWRPSSGAQRRWKGRGDRGSSKKEAKKTSQAAMASSVRTLADVTKGIPGRHTDAHFEWDTVKAEVVGALNHLQGQLASLLVGRVAPELIATTTVEVNGCETQLRALGQITVQGPQKLLLTVHRDLPQIYKALQLLPNQEAQLQIEPTGISFTFPKLTRERRDELCATVRQRGESCKESLRNIHRKATNNLKKLKPSEEDAEIIKDDLQQLQNQAIAYSRTMLDKKIEDIENA